MFFFPALSLRTLLVSAAVALITLPVHAKAEEWVGSVFVAGRWNPLGLSVETDLGPKWEIYPSENPLLMLNTARPFFFLGTSPARWATGLGFTIQPVSVFGVKAQFGQVGYFGTYGHLQTLSSPKGDWRDGTRKKDDNDNDNENANSSSAPNSVKSEITQKKTGDMALVQAYLQAKLGSIGGKFSYGFQRYDFRLGKSKKFFYDPSDDLLLEDKSWNTFASLSLVTDFLKQDYGSQFGVSASQQNVSLPEGETYWALKWGPFWTQDWMENQTLFLALQWAPHHPIRKLDSVKGIPALIVGHNSDFQL